MKVCEVCKFGGYPDSHEECRACGGPLVYAPAAETAIIGPEIVSDPGVSTEPLFSSPNPDEPALSVLELNVSHLNLGTVNRKDNIHWTIGAKNAGQGELTGRVTASAPWVQITPTMLMSGQIHQTIQIEIDPKKLAQGSYHTALISFYTTGGFKSVPVTFFTAQSWWQQRQALIVSSAVVLIFVLCLGVTLSALISNRSARFQQPAQSSVNSNDSNPQFTEPPKVAPGEEISKSEPVIPEAAAPADSPLADSAAAESTAQPDSTAIEQKSAILTLTTDLDGVQILVDGKTQGAISKGHPKQMLLPAGAHAVQAMKDGYLVWNRSVNLAIDSREGLEIAMEPQKEIAQNNVPEPSQPGNPLPKKGPDPNVDVPNPGSSSVTEPLPPPPPPPPRNTLIPISLTSSIEGDNFVVALSGRLAEPSSPEGSVNVTISAPESNSSIRSINGNLPGRPCRIFFSALENVKEHSIAESPGPLNRWSRARVRLRPKDSKGVIRFAIIWELLPDATVR